MGLRPLLWRNHEVPKIWSSDAQEIGKVAAFHTSANNNLLLSGHVHYDVLHGVALLCFDVYIITCYDHLVKLKIRKID